MFLKANVNTYEFKEKIFYFFQETTEKSEVKDHIIKTKIAIFEVF